MSPRNVKVLAVEEEGEELSFHTEVPLIPEIFPFSHPDFDSDNVKDSIVEAKEKAGGFSKRFVEGRVSIKEQEEMIVSDFTDIDELGCLDVEGLFTILGE